MELWLVYALITAFLCGIPWLVLRKTSLLERIARWRKAIGLRKKAKKKKRVRKKDGKNQSDNNCKRETKPEKDATEVKDESVKTTDKGFQKKAKKKKRVRKKDGKNQSNNNCKRKTKPEKDATEVKDESVKTTDKVDQALGPVGNAPKKKSTTNTDKGNRMDFQQILAALNTLVLTEEEAAKVSAVLRAKSPCALDARRMELKEEKAKVAQLEKLLNDQQRAAEKELNLSLAEAQCTSKEILGMKMRIQQLTEESDQTLSKLQLQNKIWWDSVKSTLERISQKCTCH